MAGCALILYHKLPGLNKYLAYLPGTGDRLGSKDVDEWFEPMFDFSVVVTCSVSKWNPPSYGQNGRLHDQVLKKGAHDTPFNTVRIEVDAHAEYVHISRDRLEKEQRAVFPRSTPVCVPIAVHESVDEVFAGFHSNWRRNVRKSKKKQGVEVIEGRLEELPQFYDLLKVTAVRDKFSVRSYYLL